MHHDYMDKFAQGHSPVHSLDARGKVALALVYTAALISVNRFQVAALAPFALGPVAVLLLAEVPLSFALRRVLILSPFILTLSLAQPIFLRQPIAAALGPWRFDVAGGWLVAGNLALKFVFGLLAVTALMCTTPFAALLSALRWFRLPAALVMMLGFLYRYLFVLIDEAMRIRRGRDFRGAALAPASRRLMAVGGIVGSLFLRTYQRGRRIHLAMTARGFDGEPRFLGRAKWRLADTAALAGGLVYVAAVWAYAFVLTRAG